MNYGVFFFIGVSWGSLGNLLFVGFGFRNKNMQRTRNAVLEVIAFVTGRSPDKAQPLAIEMGRAMTPPRLPSIHGGH